MSTAALPVELLIQIFELTIPNLGPKVGVSQQVDQSSTMANASGPVASAESSDEASDDDDDDDDDDDNDNDNDNDENENEKWDEGYFISSSDVESEDSRGWGVSDEPTQSEESEAQGPNSFGLLAVGRQRDTAVEWFALKTCRL